ncbi:hypothetical protein F4703DRAFT_1973416 [Phycomyces blakesleeanus]
MNKNTARSSNQSNTENIISNLQKSKTISNPENTGQITPYPESKSSFNHTHQSNLNQKDPVKNHLDLSEKRKWDASFTPEEQAEASSNIIKAQNVQDTEQNNEAHITKSPTEELYSDSDKSLLDVKRKVQNRVAQRAFRERKENYVNELKQKLREVQDNHVLGTRQIFYENENLRSIIRYLESENHALKRVGYSESLAEPVFNYTSTTPFIQNDPLLLQRSTEKTTTATMTTPKTTGKTTSPPPLLPTLPVHIASRPIHLHQHLATATSQGNPGPTTFDPIQFPITNHRSVSAIEKSINQHNTNTFSWRSKGPQYVFDISTPAMIRKKRHPDMTSTTPQPSTTSHKDPPYSSSCLNNPNHLPSNHSIGQLENELFDCHIDAECQSFCVMLQEQVLRSALDRLLSEPIFDTTTGALNPTISSKPGSIMFTPDSQTLGLDFDFSFGLGFNTGFGQQARPFDQSSDVNNCCQSDRRLLSCSEIWQRMHTHPHFKKFTASQLCEAVKAKVEWTDHGPVLDELEMESLFLKILWLYIRWYIGLLAYWPIGLYVLTCSCGFK